MDSLSGTVAGLLGSRWRCRCGRVHSIETKHVVSRRGAFFDLPWVLSSLGLSGRCLLVADGNTREAAGAEVKAVLDSAGLPVSALIIDPAPGKEIVHADDAFVGRVEQNIDEGIGYCIAVGGGTINDLVKLASFRRGKDYVAVPTAPSMNGYTSAIAAVEVKGIKRTINCHQPLAVVAETAVLLAAPARLRASGVGDLMSKPVCNADWMLGNVIRGEYYCHRPVEISGGAADVVAGRAAEISAGVEDAILDLFNALLLSGFSMKIAGSSAPASGGEHLISHYWDMRAEEWGREPGLHGAQVGVATLMTARLYEILRDGWRVYGRGAACGEPEHMELDVVGGFPAFYGALAAEVSAEFLKKFPSVEALRADIDSIRVNLKEIERLVWPHLVPAARIRGALKAAGAPVTFDELGFSTGQAEEALLHAREIRGRYTVLDVAWELGVLPGKADEVLEAGGMQLSLGI